MSVWTCRRVCGFASLRVCEFAGLRVGRWQAGPYLVCGLLVLAGCTVAPFNQAQAPTPLLATLTAEPTPTLSSPQPVTPVPSPDSGWQLLRNGLEQRSLTLYDDEAQANEQLYLLRLEPAAFQFSVAYHPRRPQSLAAWRAETEALLVVNGGYFTEEFVATGLIVADGQASGTSYGSFAGMLVVTSEGPQLRWLQERPYDPAEPLQHALQSFPVLVKPGGQVGFAEEDGIRSRRTVVGQDRDGRILFILAPWGSFTLHQLSNFLVGSDLNLEIALNLDGGTSTGLLLADPAQEIPAFVPLPAVITVHER